MLVDTASRVARASVLVAGLRESCDGAGESCDGVRDGSDGVRDSSDGAVCAHLPMSCLEEH